MNTRWLRQLTRLKGEPFQPAGQASLTPYCPSISLASKCTRSQSSLSQSSLSATEKAEPDQRIHPTYLQSLNLGYLDTTDARSPVSDSRLRVLNHHIQRQSKAPAVQLEDSEFERVIYLNVLLPPAVR
jgi:hypothetical protein